MFQWKNEDIENAYHTIRKSLENYDAELVKKKEIVIITKTDLIDSESLKKNNQENFKGKYGNFIRDRL